MNRGNHCSHHHYVMPFYLAIHRQILQVGSMTSKFLASEKARLALSAEMRRSKEQDFSNRLFSKSYDSSSKTGPIFDSSMESSLLYPNRSRNDFSHINRSRSLSPTNRFESLSKVNGTSEMPRSHHGMMKDSSAMVDALGLVTDMNREVESLRQQLLQAKQDAQSWKYKVRNL
jgi:hypothetical protein